MPVTPPSARLPLALLLLASTLNAQELRLPSVFSDHMVLQRDTRVPIWGWAAPGEGVAVDASWGTWGRTRADDDGRWETVLATPEAGGPYRLTVRSGGERRVIDDVLLGEVWIAGGQSNMEWTLGPSPGKGSGIDDWQALVAGADAPSIRFFDVPHVTASSPRPDVDARWVVSSPTKAPSFSAVAWLFAKELHDELGVPVGVVSSNWGGTLAEAWTSAEGLAHIPEMAAGLAEVATSDARSQQLATAAADDVAAWWAALDERDPGLQQAWYDPDLGDDDWATVPATFRFAEHGLADWDGTVWLRRRLYVPDRWRGHELRLELGPIDDLDQVWLEGRLLGGTTAPGSWQTRRSYTLPSELTREPELVLAVRVVDTGGAGGLTGADDELALVEQDTGARRRLVLPWRLARGAGLEGVPELPSADGALSQHLPSVLFNGMIAPVAPFRARGVIFYQGESNRMGAALYRRLLPALIADWRRAFRVELPFYYVQIAPFAYGGDTGQASELREAQELTLSVRGTGMVVTADVGDPRDIHPTDKAPVAQRLALLARQRLFAQPGLVASSPVASGFAVAGGELRVRFDGLGSGGLTTRDDDAPSHLELAGDDGVWSPAQGRLDGQELVVTSADVPSPVAVRHAWGAADEPNLSGPTGLPVGPFRLPRP